MSESRRFSDDEVQQILEWASLDDTAAASEPSRLGAPAGDRASGLTLQQLQDIAVEAGIDQTAVARAAERVARGELVPVEVRYSMGAPVAVAKTIELGRSVDDPTWDRIVVLLRDTFAARGRVRLEGGLREWSNGNLSAVLEPTANGHRLRVSTRKGDAAVFRLLGNVFLGVPAMLAGLVAVKVMATGGAVDASVWATIGAMGLGGIGMHLRNFFMLRGWGRERAAQLDALPAQLKALIDPRT